ncbi:hypothetical protein [Kutzneria buriramensis]|uniref:BNR repeat protein n=1 Tax=Kutzneria buriramensis TaxID=1045776 RepID=A0A3E0HUY4_9PSEU|nr:hypothetical protein [Kutzneria buriramensis]REH50248.1 hypothetical protein BCF44_104524 [Kutzneria buriramensis]
MRGRNYAIALLALALAGCGHAAQSAPTRAHGDFVKHPDSVQAGSFDGDTTTYGIGINVLVPTGTCAIGIGTYKTGYDTIGDNWNGSADCTSFKLPDHAPTGTSLAPNPTSAIGQPGGSVIVGAATVQRLDPDGTVTSLADLGLGSTGKVTALAQTGNRLLIAGSQNNGYPAPKLWTSTDGGKTATPVQLPATKGDVGALAANDGTVVAVEAAAEKNTDGSRQLGVWRSLDGGQNWQLTKFATGQSEVTPTGVLHTTGGWLIFGNTSDGQQTGTFLATSSDGAAWKVVDASFLGGGVVTGVTGTDVNDLVFTGQTTIAVGQQACGLAWTGALGSMTRVDLGCDDVPKAVTTLSDGRVVVVGGTAVWVRA